MGSVTFRLAEPLFLHHRRDVAVFRFSDDFSKNGGTEKESFTLVIIMLIAQDSFSSPPLWKNLAILWQERRIMYQVYVPIVS